VRAPMVAKGTPTKPTSTTAVAVLTSFPAMDLVQQYNAFGADQNLSPPDTQVAAGPSVFVEAVNSNMSVWSKTGTRLSLVDLNRFFNMPTGYSFSDPRIVYDAPTARWILSGFGYNPTTRGSVVYLAASKTSDPMGLWRVYPVKSTPTLTSDQPKLGVSTNTLVLSWAVFDATDQFLGQETWVLDKAQMLAGTTVQVSRINPDPSRFDIVPVVSVTPTTTQYLAYNNSCGTADVTSASCTTGTPSVGLMAVTGSPGMPGGVTWSETDPAMRPTTYPPNARQGTLLTLVDTGDDRFLSAMSNNGGIVIAAGDACKPLDSNVISSCGRIVSIDVSGATPALTLDADVGLGMGDVYYPAAITDPSGNIFVSATESGIVTDPTAAVLAFPVGSPTVSGQLQGGLRYGFAGTFAGFRAAPGDRWGDYSGIAVDPTDPYHIVVAAEYAPELGPKGVWSTAIGVTTLALPTVTSVTPTVGPTSGRTTLTVTGHDFFAGYTQVSIGSDKSESVTVTSPTTMTVVTPPGLGGVLPISVSTTLGAAPAVPAFTFTNRHVRSLIGYDSTGTGTLYPGNGTGGFFPRRTFSSGLSKFDAILSAGDFDGDGYTSETIIDRVSSGALGVYRVEPTAEAFVGRLVGSGWQQFTSIVGSGDFDGDGHVDLIARTAAGALRLYPGNGSNGFLAMRVIGSGWQQFTSIVGSGDFDGDGHVDLIARTAAGALKLYPGNGSGGFLAARVIGSGWQQFTAIVGSGDWDGDGHVDLIARTAAGALKLYPGNGSGGFLAARVIGSGWQRFTTIVGLGDTNP